MVIFRALITVAALLSIPIVARCQEATVNVGWAIVSEVKAGWRFDSVRELGNWNLAVQAGDVVTAAEGIVARSMGPIWFAGILREASGRVVPIVVVREGKEVVLNLFANAPTAVPLSERYGIGAAISDTREVAAVIDGGPAERAGLQKGDIVIAVDGKSVREETGQRVSSMIISLHPSPVHLRVMRGGEQIEIEVPRTKLRSSLPASAVANRPPVRTQERGDAAPDFILPGINGQRVQLSSLRGSWVLLDFWATWCAPCRIEAPTLEHMAQRYRGKLTVIGADTGDTVEDTQKYLSQNPVSYPIVFAGELTGPTAAAYNVRTLPVSVLISPSGTVRYIEDGYLPGSLLERVVEEAVEPQR